MSYVFIKNEYSLCSNIFLANQYFNEIRLELTIGLYVFIIFLSKFVSPIHNFLWWRTIYRFFNRKKIKLRNDRLNNELINARKYFIDMDDWNDEDELKRKLEQVIARQVVDAALENKHHSD